MFRPVGDLIQALGTKPLTRGEQSIHIPGRLTSVNSVLTHPHQTHLPPPPDFISQTPPLRSELKLDPFLPDLNDRSDTMSSNINYWDLESAGESLEPKGVSALLAQTHVHARWKPEPSGRTADSRLGLGAPALLALSPASLFCFP